LVLLKPPADATSHSQGHGIHFIRYSTSSSSSCHYQDD
jgi:hypothetical protein